MITAVILAAGKSTRTHPFTITTPKPLLPILGKPLLSYTLDMLKETGGIKDVIIIVGYKKEQIIQAFGASYQGMKIRYVEQKIQDGTGGALLAAKDALSGRFLVLNGDDLYSSEDITRCLAHDHCVLASETDDPSKWGIYTAKDGKVTGFTEKPAHSESRLCNTGAYVFDTSIFTQDLAPTERGEIEITDYIMGIVRRGKDVMLEQVRGHWLAVGYPWNILEANIHFLKQLEMTHTTSIIKGTISEHATVNGFIILEEGAEIREHCHLEGPIYIGKGTKIGPFCHIRPDTIIGENCTIGKMELFDAVIMDRTTAKHTGYIAHSVVGREVNIGAGTITADYRHDGKNHTTLIQGKKMDSGRRKLGAFIGDKVKTGIGTLIYPGRKLWPGQTTLPGEIVDSDKTEAN